MLAFASFSMDDKAHFRDAATMKKALELVAKSEANKVQCPETGKMVSLGPLFRKPITIHQKSNEPAEVGDVVHSDGTRTRLIDGCSEIQVIGEVVNKKVWSGCSTTRIRPDTSEQDIIDIVAVTGCGKCPVCLLRRTRQKAGSIELEIEHAWRLRKPVTFWTLTLSSEQVFQTYRRQGVGTYETELASGEIKYSTKYKDVPGEIVARARVNYWTIKKMVNAFRKDMNRKYGVRVLTVMEPHKDGVWHAHAIAIGFAPEIHYGASYEENKYGNPKWTFPKGNTEWVHGRVEVVRIVDEHQATRTARYLGKYAVKGASLSEDVANERKRIDGNEAMKASTIGWMRSPATGVAGLDWMVREHTDELIAGGWEMFGSKALDYDRMRRAREHVRAMTNKEIPKLTTVDERLESLILKTEFLEDV